MILAPGGRIFENGTSGLFGAGAADTLNAIGTYGAEFNQRMKEYVREVLGYSGSDSSYASYEYSYAIGDLSVSAVGFDSEASSPVP